MGTPDYLAPEVLLGESQDYQHSIASDNHSSSAELQQYLIAYALNTLRYGGVR